MQHRPEQWITVKEAAALRGRHVETVKRWVVLGVVRVWREPGGRVLLFLPDVMPPTELPPLPLRRRGGS